MERFIAFFKMWHIFKISILSTFCLYFGSTISTQNSKFNVYWNVPTSLCKRHSENFESTLQKFNIKHNSGDKFRGEIIAILYDPGLFPIVKKDENNTDIKINGGIPQLASIDNHLVAFESTLKLKLPPKFEGIGVIDFEKWRPIFRQNWNKQEIYKNLSIDLSKSKDVKKLKTCVQILEDAQNEFEKAATEFMKKTLEKAKCLFPKASWGYYGFPHCYNHYSDDITTCAKDVNDENDRIQGIFDKSDALFPSIYMNKSMSQEDKKKLVIGRIKEAERVWKKANQKAFVLPYMWIRYLDVDKYLIDVEIEDSLEIAKTNNAGGVIIWGRSEDVDSKCKCQKLHTFLKNTFGPAIKKVLGN